jgi:hypothetical protein
MADMICHKVYELLMSILNSFITHFEGKQCMLYGKFINIGTFKEKTRSIFHEN